MRWRKNEWQWREEGRREGRETMWRKGIGKERGEEVREGRKGEKGRRENTWRKKRERKGEEGREGRKERREEGKIYGGKRRKGREREE